MKYFIVMMFLFSSFANASIVNWKFVKVVDGDTIAFVNSSLPKELEKLSVRIIGIDTPESTYLAKCEKEKKLGIEAKEFLKKHVTGKQLTIDVLGWDKYGGRVLGNVYVNNVSVKDTLIKNGYAKPYDGGKKSSWCE